MSKNILVVDNLETRYALRQLFVAEGYELIEANDLDSMALALTRHPVDLALIDAHTVMNEGDDAHLETLRALRRRHDFLVVVMVAGRDIGVVRKFVQLGAYDHVQKPLDPRVLLPLIRNAVERSQVVRQVQVARQKIEARQGLQAIVAGSTPMLEVKQLVRQVAAHDATVMILGESGTGKEMVARAIHHESGRRQGPFVPINCGALPRELVESELFGHDKGAFTGATAARAGKFEQANGGTIFLDEIGDMPLEAQVKLLRVIEERRVARLGSKRDIDIDVRVLCATNANIESDLLEGRFRKDLFYRLNVISIEMPPLREREDDIVLLAESFIRDFTGENIVLAGETRRRLKNFPWGGNVRELRNAVERAMILSGPHRAKLDAVLQEHCGAPPPPPSRPQLVPEVAPSPPGAPIAEPPAMDGPLVLPRTVDERLEALIGELLETRDPEREDHENLLGWFEERVIWTAFVRSGYNKAKAARLVGIERKAFERRLSRLRP